MKIKEFFAKINLFYKEKVEPNTLVLSSAGLVITLLVTLVFFLNSARSTGYNLNTYVWLANFGFGLVALIYFFIRTIVLYTQIHAFTKKSVDVAKQAMAIAQKWSDFFERPHQPKFIVDRYLSIKSVYIYYINDLHVNDLYQQVVGRKQLQTVTEEWVEQKGSGISIGYKDVLHGDISDNSTNKLSGTSQYLEPGLDEKFLTVQSSYLRLDNVAVGYEYSIFQIENNNDDAEIDDYEKWASRESERLSSLSGLILLDADFLVQELVSPQTNYQLTSTRPLVLKSVVGSTVTFRITVSKDLIKVNEQLILSNHLGGKIKFHVFGYVTIKTKDYTDNEIMIDIAPLVIYT